MDTKEPKYHCRYCGSCTPGVQIKDKECKDCIHDPMQNADEIRGLCWSCHQEHGLKFHQKKEMKFTIVKVVGDCLESYPCQHYCQIRESTKLLLCGAREIAKQADILESFGDYSAEHFTGQVMRLIKETKIC
jgi:hypothetical protein